MGVVRHWKEGVGRKHPDMWLTHDWLLHHDGAPTHTALTVQEFLTKNNMAVTFYHLFPRKKGPCGFFPFPRMKIQDIVEIGSQAVMDSIKERQFERCLQQLERRWTRYMHSDFFEGTVLICN
jgi:hypothetical protein